MAEAARICVGLGAEVIDINFGCPVRKVAVGQQAGSALMRDEAAAGRASNLIGAIACGSRVAAHKASACSAAAMISSGPTPSPNSAPKRINAGAPPAANAPPARTTRPARVASAEPRAAMWR